MGASACGACGSPLATDQRYCLECGERRPAVSDFLRAGPPSQQSAPPKPPAVAPPVSPAGGKATAANPWLGVIAGVGVLLLAMGVGVLIGRAGNSNSKPAPAQVITIGGVAGSATTGTSEETFTGDWPAGKKGFTVQLQTLPEGTSAAAVSQAKSAATTRGAGAVGALEESSYSSLSGSGYLIYSGVYTSKSEAQKALKTLKSKFSGAKVVEVANSASSKATESSSSGGSSAGQAGLPKAAPAKVLEKESHAKGKSYVEESSKLPDVIETR